MTTPRRVLVAVGSNLGDTRGNVLWAIGEIANGFSNVRASTLYLTKPVGCRDSAPDYVNACASFDSDLSPLELLFALRKLELAAGRSSLRTRNEDRTLDLDLICLEGETHSSEDLEVPHPRAHTRAFVLLPANEIEPHLRLAQGLTVAEACAQLALTAKSDTGIRAL
jgi:2-amino-4-hydroxy-6-hydroxymethyldihydropteridine diphosphokinase